MKKTWQNQTPEEREAGRLERQARDVEAFRKGELEVPEWCPRCNGYGSSLAEESDRCSLCGGTGLAR